MAKLYTAAEAATELGVSPLYIHRLLRSEGVKREHSIWLIDEATMRRLKVKRAGAATARRKGGRV